LDVDCSLTRPRVPLGGAPACEDLLVRCVVHATIELRGDQHLSLMLASEPGDTLGNRPVDGFPRISRGATIFLAPFGAGSRPRRGGARLVELLARLVISY